MSTLTLQEQLHNAAELVQQARKIVALTGAGISTESGIPDFRSPGSIWQAAPPVSYHDFISKLEARQQYWQTRRNLSSQVAALQRRMGLGNRCLMHCQCLVCTDCYY